ncbi:MAG: HNH endonuclease, partial [Propionibacteriales bacterium]|nr:HNH endonuclease [Propionibacteriales bacterium]
MLDNDLNLPPTARRRKPRRSLAAAAVLAGARAAQVDAHAAEARKLAAAVEWAALHAVEDEDLAETWGDTPITLTGEGAPLIGRGCVAEFAAVIGTTTNGGRAYLADAVELAHRLPAVYARIQAGTLPTFKGRRIARETTILPEDAVLDLDTRIAPLAGKLSAAATQKMIDETIAAVMPDYVQDLADNVSRPQVVVDHRQVSFQGTSSVYGALDLADALDLDARLDQEAQVLKDQGCEASLDARRAMALGRLARGETSSAPGTGRAVTLYVHLPADTTNPTAWVENGGGHLLTQTQVAGWCAQPDVKVTIKPVIDLAERVTATSYVVPDNLKEHLELRDRTCVFPHCDKPARGCQKDHTHPYDQGGPTSSENLGNL